MNFLLATEKEIISEISNRLKKHRILSNLTQEELSIKAGISVATLRRFEGGKDISLENFFKIVMSLGLVDELSDLFKQKPITISQMEKFSKSDERQRVRKKL